MKLQAENQAIEIISGFLRPIRSASQPAPVAPISRNHKVSVKTAVTAVSGTSNSLAIGSMMNTKIVKSNASSVQPSHAATQACHCSLVGSRHHAICGRHEPMSSWPIPPPGQNGPSNGTLPGQTSQTARHLSTICGRRRHAAYLKSQRYRLPPQHGGHCDVHHMERLAALWIFSPGPGYALFTSRMIRPRGWSPRVRQTARGVSKQDAVELGSPGGTGP